jgi:transcriptional regulator with XRE-family HTH domain
MGLVRIFGRNVRAAREAAGLTQEDLEGLTGLRRSYISDMERGTRNPSLRALEKVAAALGVLPEALLRLPEDAAWMPGDEDGKG